MLPSSEDSHASPLLSIAVPNRNQIGGLKVQEACLRKFALEYEIEVLVSDNHSEDGSAEYLENNWSDFAQISLLPENIGIGGNLRNLALRASGQWIWFIGAGDLPDQTGLLPILSLLRETPETVSTLIDEGAYECLSPFLGGVVYRKSSLLAVFATDTDAIWPHVSWSLALEHSSSEAQAGKTSLIHIQPWTSRNDWHSVRSTFPYALALNALLREAVSRSPRSRRLASDLLQSEKTLLTWYAQDRMAGKVWGLNPSLLQALRFSGGITQFKFLKILAIGISFLPLRVLNIFK